MAFYLYSLNKYEIKYVYVTYLHIYLIINKTMKDWNVTDSYEMPFSLFEETVDEWPLIENGAIVHYLAFSTDTITFRNTKPSFTATYSHYGRLLGRYLNYGVHHKI